MAKNIVDIILRARADTSAARKELDALFRSTEGASINSNQALKLKEEWLSTKKALEDYASALESIDEQTANATDTKAIEKMGKAAETAFSKFLKLWKGLDQNNLINTKSDPLIDKIKTTSGALAKLWGQFEKTKMPEFDSSSGVTDNFASQVNNLNKQFSEAVINKDAAAIDQLLIKYNQLITKATQYQNQSKDTNKQDAWKNAITSLTEFVSAIEDSNGEIIRNNSELAELKVKADAAAKELEDMRSEANGVADSFKEGNVQISNFNQTTNRTESEVSELINQFARFTTIAGALEVVTNAIRSSYQAVKELDEAMNSIAVVTDMTTQDLWDQIDAYTELATATGSTIKGSYEVAQLYYQQGLNTADVMTATEETLKMARIAQIDYASATDYATAAIKGFNLAHEDLAHINDVYSNLAAKTAADTEEISIAMSKVASIAHSTGMELETTAAFLTQIIATTREAPETAGTALKTVIARFSEVKKLIGEGGIMGTDEEGEEINVNKIEGALKTAGVQLRDTAGQMRDLDDVFLELASKWDSLDTMQQRYIATQAAGSRQQSRFLALMNNYDELMTTVGYATDAAGASNEQFEKTLDSLESKLNALSNAWVEFTTGIADSRLIKGAVDFLTMVLEAINEITGALGEVGTPLSRIVLLFGGLRVAGGALGSIASGLGFERIAAQVGTLSTVFNGKTISNIKTLKEALQVGAGTRANFSTEIEKTTLAMKAFIKAGNLYSIAANKAAGATGVLGKVISKIGFGGTIGLTVAAITGIIWLIDKLTISSKEASEAYAAFSEQLEQSSGEIQQITTQTEQLNSILNDTIQILNESGEAIGNSNWLELSEGVDNYGRNLALTNEEMATYKQLAEEIVNLGLADSYEDLHDKLRENPNYLQEATKDLERQRQFKAVETDLEYNRATQRGYLTNFEEKKIALEEYEINVKHNPLAGNYGKLTRPNSTDFVKLNDETYKLYVEYYDILLDKINNYYNSHPNDRSKKDIKNILIEKDNVQRALQQWQQESGKRDYAQEQLEQASNAARDMLANYAQTFDSFYERNPQEQKWLLNFIEKSTKFAIDENTTQEDIEAWRDDIANILAFDWSAIDVSKTDGKTGEQLKATLMTMLPDPDETAAEWMARYREVLQQIWDGMSDEMKQSYEGDFSLFAEAMNMPQYDMSSISQAISNQGIESTLWGRATDKGQMPITSDSQRYASWEGLIPELQSQLSVDQLEAVMGGKINIGELIATDESIDTVQEVIDAIIKEYERLNEIQLNGLDTDFEKMADAARDLGDDLADIDYSDIIDDKVIDESDKFTESWFEAKEAFTAFREEYGEALDTLGETSNLDLSAEGLTRLSAEAKLAGQSLAQYALEKIRASNIILASSVDALNADAGGAAGAAAMFAEAANAQWAYDNHQPYTTAGGKVLSGDDLGKYAASMGGYASLVGASTGGKSGGGGGGGSKEPAKAEQDPFYNYIKQAEQYENALKRLENQWEILSNPADLKANLNEQEDAIIGVMAANQAYLTEVNSSLSKMQADMTSKFGKYLSFAEDGSIRLNENYFNATGKIVEEMDAWIDQYDDILGRQTDLNDELDDYKKQLKDLWEGWRDDYIDLTDQLAEIYQERDEKILEEKEEYYETLEEQDKKYLESVRRNIDAERKARQKARTYEDLADKQKRLAMLERDTSGRYTNEVLQLREEIGQTQQDMADSEVDEVLDALERQNEEEAERHKEILEAMQQQIDENIENRVYIERAEETIAMGDQAILDVLMTSEEYLQSSDAQRQKMIDEWGPQIVNAQKFIEQGFQTAAEYIDKISESMNLMSAKLANAIGQIKVTVNNYSGGGGGGGSIVTTPSPNTGGEGTRQLYRDPGNGQGAVQVRQKNDKYEYYFTLYNLRDLKSEKFTGMASTQPAAQSLGEQKRNQLLAKKYKKGGLVNYTGPAWVDGTPGNPEAFLNADQTRIISEFAQHLSRIVNNHIPSFSNPMVASSGGDCNITIEIGSLGANYDIDKAIAKVKDEIVRATSYRGVNIVKRTR